MKRKLLALGMVLVLLMSVFALAGCEQVEQLTAYKLVTDAVAKTEALESADMTLKMDMSVSAEGMTMDIPMSYDIKATDLKTESPKVSMKMTATVIGMSMDIDAYVENGYYYMSMMGEKVKYKAEDAAQYDALGQADSMMMDLPEDVLKDVAIIKNEDGTKTVKVTMNADAFKAVYDELIAATGSSAASGATLSAVNIANAEVEITVAESGYVTDYKVKFDMNMTMDMLGESSTASAKIDMSLKYNEPGKTVTVTAPEGYQDYEEMSLDSLG